MRQLLTGLWEGVHGYLEPVINIVVFGHASATCKQRCHAPFPLVFKADRGILSDVLQNVREELIVHREVPAVSKIMAVFELALRRAASTVLGSNAGIRGFFFHFSQVRCLMSLLATRQLTVER